MPGRPVKPLPEIEGLNLTRQQLAVYTLVKSGLPVKEAASVLGISAKLVSKQLGAIRRKEKELSPVSVTSGPGDKTAFSQVKETVLWMAEGKNLRPAQIARLLNLSPQAIRTGLCRLRKKTGGAVGLKKILAYRIDPAAYLPPEALAGTGLGLRLRNRRLNAGISVGDLARRLNLPDGLLERVEQGELLPSWSVMKNICGALGVELEDLVMPCGKASLKNVLACGVRREKKSGNKDRRCRGQLKRLSAAGGEKVVLDGPSGRVIMHAKGGTFAMRLGPESRFRAKAALAARHLKPLEVKEEGDAIYRVDTYDLLAVKEELAATCPPGS